MTGGYPGYRTVKRDRYVKQALAYSGVVLASLSAGERPYSNPGLPTGEYAVTMSPSRCVSRSLRERGNPGTETEPAVRSDEQ